MKLGKYNAGVECGQRWWRPRSWRKSQVRKIDQGFAVGPLMFWRDPTLDEMIDSHVIFISEFEDSVALCHSLACGSCNELFPYVVTWNELKLFGGIDGLKRFVGDSR